MRGLLVRLFPEPRKPGEQLTHIYGIRTDFIVFVMVLIFALWRLGIVG